MSLYTKFLYQNGTNDWYIQKGDYISSANHILDNKQVIIATSTSHKALLT